MGIVLFPPLALRVLLFILSDYQIGGRCQVGHGGHAGLEQEVEGIVWLADVPDGGEDALGVVAALWLGVNQWRSVTLPLFKAMLCWEERNFKRI